MHELLKDFEQSAELLGSFLIFTLTVTGLLGINRLRRWLWAWASGELEETSDGEA